MIVLDASFLIAHLDASDAHHSRATALLIAHAGEPLALSPLTLAEVLVGPIRAGRLAVMQAALSELRLTTVGLADDAPQRLAQLRVDTSLHLPDCCVLLAALTADAAVATFDNRLSRTAALVGADVLN